MSLLLLSTAFLSCQPFTAAGASIEPSEAVELRYAPAAGTQIRRTYESTASFDLDAFGMLMDGEEPPFDIPKPTLTVVATEKIVVLDTIEGVEDGRPKSVSREYEELLWTTTFTSEEGEESEEEICDLVGETVEFEWDEDEESFVVSADEDTEVDAGQFELLKEDMDLRAFLPEDEVEVDDTWELSTPAYLALVWPGGVMQPHAEGEEIDQLQLQMALELIDGVDFEGSATLTELREEDDQVIAVISYELEVTSSGEIEVEPDEDSEGGAVILQRGLERTLKGEILWDIEAGHALSLEGQADSEMISTTTETVLDPEGGEHELERSQEFSGSVTYEVTFEVQ